jgi:protein-S-isoprenylcysteine O-methyltransferase Ste14
MTRSTRKLSDNHKNAWSFRLGPHLVRILSAVIGITALVAFTVFVFTGPWNTLLLYKDARAILAFDLGLSLAFFIQHSGMIRHTFQKWFERFIPGYYFSAIFSIVSGIVLYFVVFFWQTTEQTIISLDGSWRTGTRFLFFTALAGIIWSNLALRSFDIFGLRAIKCHLTGKTPSLTYLTEVGPYRWVRHPQYFFILVMIWSNPDLTADRLLFNILWSTWIVAGTVLEERDLTALMGRQYKDYQSRVPMLIPFRLPH